MVSIIIPFFNTGKECIRLVKKLLDDRFSDIEIICVDDCSTDDSLKKMKALAKSDKRLKVIAQEKNSGSAAARNRGLEEATGDLIVFLDSDDEVTDWYLIKMTDAMKNPKIATAICGIRQNYLHSTKIVDKFVEPASPRGENEAWREYLLRLLTEDAHLYSCVNKIYRGDVVRKHKLRFNEKLKFAEDTDFVLDYLGCFKEDAELKFIRDPLYTYNYGTATSVVSTSSLDWANWQKNLDDIAKWASKVEHVDALMKRLRRRFKISHALAVARAKQPLRKKLSYERNPFLLLAASIVVKIKN